MERTYNTKLFDIVDQTCIVAEKCICEYFEQTQDGTVFDTCKFPDLTKMAYQCAFNFKSNHRKIRIKVGIMLNPIPTAETAKTIKKIKGYETYVFGALKQFKMAYKELKDAEETEELTDFKPAILQVNEVQAEDQIPLYHCFKKPRIK